MKTFYTLKNSLFVSITLICAVALQDAKGNFVQETRTNTLPATQKVSLMEVLDQLKESRQIEFLYEEENLVGKYVSALANHTNQNIETILKNILTNSGLKFEKIKKNTYAIIPVSKKTSVKTIKSSAYLNTNSSNYYADSSIDSPVHSSRKLLSATIFKQEKQITGKVTSSDDGLPLPGVNVIVKDTNNGTVTDMDGNYKLSVPENAEALVFSFIGYTRKEVLIEAKSIINVELTSDITQLSEIVVTALGFKEEKDKLGYTSSKVDGAQIANSGEGNIINGIAGKASGVRITRTSGDPGAGSHIQIRGASTIGRSIQPLIVVDGIPISNSSTGGGTGGVVQQSRLNDINPDDIARVDILKGSSAAALWGTRAANGVIMITTKKGRTTDKIDITYRSSYSVDKILTKHDLQTAYGQGNNGNFEQGTQRSWGDKIADREGGADLVDSNGAFFRAQDGTMYYNILQKRSRDIFTDSNYDLVFQDGNYFDNSLSLSGGNEKSNLFFSLSDFNQQGVVRANSDYRRSTFRLNADMRFNDVIKISSNASYMRTQSNRVRRGNSSSGMIIPLLRTPADFDNTDYIGDYYAAPNAQPIRNRQRAYRNPIGAGTNPRFNNPMWSMNRQQNEAIVNRVLMSSQANITPANWLEFVLRGGIDNFTERRNEFIYPFSAGQVNSTGAFSDNMRQRLQFNSDVMAIVKPDLGDKFNTEALIGFNYNSRKTFFVGGSISNFILPIELKDFNNAQRDFTDIGDSESLRRTAAAYTSVTIGYNEMLFATITGRYETASTFGEESDNNFFYPSITAAWQFSQLPSLMGSTIFSFGKLRVAYAEVGIQPGIYNTVSEFIPPNYSDPFGGSIDAALYGDGTFLPSASVGNPFLKPERKKEIEFGTDLRFFDHRLKTSFTYYYNRTTDILFNIPIATSAGYSRIYDNAGTMENRGMEVDISYNIIKNNDFSWSVGVLWDRNKNEVLGLKGVENLDLGGLGGISSRAVEGQQLGVLWGAKWARNENGSIQLGENGFPNLASTDGVIGDPNPDWRGSAMTQFSYKNFSLNILFETFQGADIAAGTRGVLTDYGLTPETAIETTAPQDLLTYTGAVIPAGTTFRGNIQDFGSGPVALTEAWYTGAGGYFNGAFEQFIEDGSWTRLREVAVSYSLNSTKFRDLTKLQSIEFSATGRNLLVWTKFEGNDPDTNLTGVSTARGIDYFNSPGTQSYIFTIKIRY